MFIFTLTSWNNFLKNVFFWFFFIRKNIFVIWIMCFFLFFCFFLFWSYPVHFVFLTECLFFFLFFSLFLFFLPLRNLNKEMKNKNEQTLQHPPVLPSMLIYTDFPCNGSNETGQESLIYSFPNFHQDLQSWLLGSDHPRTPTVRLYIDLSSLLRVKSPSRD